MFTCYDYDSFLNISGNVPLLLTNDSEGQYSITFKLGLDAKPIIADATNVAFKRVGFDSTGKSVLSSDDDVEDEQIIPACTDQSLSVDEKSDVYENNDEVALDYYFSDNYSTTAQYSPVTTDSQEDSELFLDAHSDSWSFEEPPVQTETKDLEKEAPHTSYDLNEIQAVFVLCDLMSQKQPVVNKCGFDTDDYYSDSSSEEEYMREVNHVPTPQDPEYMMVAHVNCPRASKIKRTGEIIRPVGIRKTNKMIKRAKKVAYLNKKM